MGTSCLAIEKIPIISQEPRNTGTKHGHETRKQRQIMRQDNRNKRHCRVRGLVHGPKPTNCCNAANVRLRDKPVQLG